MSVKNRLGIDQLAAQCDKVRWQGKDSFLACCVAHDDTNPSMAVTESADGTILAHCFAGCDQRSVLEGLGMWSDKVVSRSDTTTRPNLTTVRKPADNRQATSDYYKKLWDGAYDPVQPFSKPFTGNPDHLVCNHPYSTLKGIAHQCGARRGFASGKLIGKNADCIIVPTYDMDGTLVGVECIGTPDSSGKTPKQSFGRKGVLILGNDLDPAIPVLMVEGWASGVSWVWHMNDGNACAAVYFGKSSGSKKQAELQARYPNHIVLLGIEQDD